MILAIHLLGVKYFILCDISDGHAGTEDYSRDVGRELENNVGAACGQPGIACSRLSVHEKDGDDQVIPITCQAQSLD
jgi:hypothetical protein